MADIKKAEEKFLSCGLHIPEILLPSETVDLKLFSCIACDQHSAEPEYWDDVKRLVGSAPSSLKLMLPEAYLERDFAESKKKSIPKNMQAYIDKGILSSIGRSSVFVERKCSSGIRKGLILALDLEAYDYRPGSAALIRASEKTVIERLPARTEVRRGAPLEMPHIMVLFSDKNDRVFNAVKDAVSKLKEDESGSPKTLYNFDLMKNSGSIRGFKIASPESLEKIADAFLKLKAVSKESFLFAVGDGNHSLAAAKNYWEEIKPGLSPDEVLTHPARFALAEFINLYDEALEFEPIHRLIMDVDKKEFLSDLGLNLNNPPPLQELQPKIDLWMETHPKASQEYIHGEDNCRRLEKSKPGRLAICFGHFDKDRLFPDLEKYGSLCRKSFSMGRAEDKRFYLELRKIRL